MAEYDRIQKKQESRAIANSGTGSRQLKRIVDNRQLMKSQTSLNDTVQLGKDKHRRLKENAKQNPLFNVEINSKTAHKRLGSFTLKDINTILRPTGYTATSHFLERIASNPGTQRWKSMGVYDGKDLSNFLSKGIQTTQIYGGKKQDIIRFTSGGIIPINANKLITITF